MSGCSLRVLQPVGPVADANHLILLNAVVIMLCIIVPTMVATLAVVWWFRPGNSKARRLPDWSFSGRIEIVTWSVPLMTIIFLGGIGWIGSHEMDPAKPLKSSKKPLEVQVMSLDWKWLFIYPDQKVASLNQLVLPVGTPVHFALTSASVWNVFFVPQLGSMIYTMNGMADQLNLQADKVGSYYGESSMISGDGFPDMHFETKVVSDGDFEAWTRTAQGAQAVLDEDGYKALARQSVNNPPTLFRVSDNDLFNKVVTQKLPPGPGPDQSKPNATVSPKQGS